MKIRTILASLAAAFLFFFLTGKVFVSKAISIPRVPFGSEATSRKIVVFKPVASEGEKEALIQKFGGVKIKDLRLINAKAVLLSPAAVEALKRQDGVLRIDDDVVVEALADRRPMFYRRVKPTSTPTPAPAQVLPWGIDRIEAEKVWATTSAELVKVGIVDTGIDVKHPDLKDNLKGGVSTVLYTRSYDDDNGHGTHVAGIVAALNNSFGVVGVGPGIDLYAVKVLDRRGNGYLSDVIEGLDWAIANGMQVVNMSLGTSSDVQSFHDAVQRVNSAGIVQVAAAGNSGGAVIYPAAYPEVIAVSATDQSDTLASWSSRGAEVDLAAPGVDIYSTYKGSTYKTLSGTSMASPHVAGVAALVLSVPSKCDYNADRICSPAEVQQRLETTAEDLGVSGRDDLYGYGLVNAEKAVVQ
ncbi:MAG: S8 family peptidase [Microgenomates group bacterium]